MDPRAIDLNKLRTFFVIAEEGGVSSAARHLALTRSAVSHSLAGLEDDLGVALFDRVGKRMVLTPEGRRMRRAFADVDASIRAALEDVGRAQIEARGTVRLGVFLGALRFPIAEMLESLLKEQPGIAVRMAYGSQAELRRRLIEGQLDLCLAVRSPDRGSEEIHATRLTEQRLVLASRERLSGKRGLPGILELPIIDYFRSEPIIDRWVQHHYGRRKVSDRQVRVWAASTDLALDLTLRGVGACVLPKDLVEPLQRRGELVIIRGRKAPLRDDVWLDEVAGAQMNRGREALRMALLSGFGR